MGALNKAPVPRSAPESLPSPPCWPSSVLLCACCALTAAVLPVAMAPPLRGFLVNTVKRDVAVAGVLATIGAGVAYVYGLGATNKACEAAHARRNQE
eukprot:m.286799 g.286799  ORF g.286799 m.286799 type:complete len:97 (+) comp11642_c0_seq1:225-515(+)